MNKVEIDTCGGPEPSPAFLWYSVSSPVVVFSLMMQAKAIGSHSFATESVRFLPNSWTLCSCQSPSSIFCSNVKERTNKK